MRKSISATDRRTGNDDAEIVFAVDESDDERHPDRAIIADIARDGAWISTPAADAPRLSEWR